MPDQDLGKWEQYVDKPNAPQQSVPQQAGGLGKWEQYVDKPQAPAQTPAPQGPQGGATGRFLSGLGSGMMAANPLAGLGHAIMHPLDTATDLVKAQGGEFKKAYDSFNQPGWENQVQGVGHTLAGMLPIAGPAAANIGEQAGNQAGTGDYAGAIGKGLGYVGTTAAIPVAAKGVGKLAQSAAPGLAETAMGVRNIDRYYQREPGQAILQDTSGVRPATVSASAKAKMGDLAGQRDAIIKASPNNVDLTQATKPLYDTLGKAIDTNSLGTKRALDPMLDHWEKDRFQNTQRPSMTVSPIQAQNLKEGFSNDHVTWNPERGDLANQAAKRSYGAIDKAIDAAAPGSGELNDRISSLTPVAKRADAKAAGAGLGQRVMGRMGAHTGALLGSAGGALLGSHLGLPMGGAIGGAAGLVIPELAASPTLQMIGARSINSAGKVLANPTTGRVIGTGSLLNAVQRK